MRITLFSKLWVVLSSTHHVLSLRHDRPDDLHSATLWKVRVSFWNHFYKMDQKYSTTQIKRKNSYTIFGNTELKKYFSLLLNKAEE